MENEVQSQWRETRGMETLSSVCVCVCVCESFFQGRVSFPESLFGGEAFWEGGDFLEMTARIELH